MKPHKEAVKKLRKLQKYFLDEPKRLNMDAWGNHIDPKDKSAKKQLKQSLLDDENDNLTVLLSKNPPCGTMACIAGGLCIVGGLIKPEKELKQLQQNSEYDSLVNKFYYNFDEYTPDLAADYLGMAKNDVDPLFFLKSWGRDVGWPEEFDKELEKHNPGTKGYAKVTVDRIEHFINTGE